MSTNCCDHATRQYAPPEGITLRAMKTSDLPHVRALHRSLLPVSYPAAFFLQLLINPRQLCLVAIDLGSIVGFASATVGLTQPGAIEAGTLTVGECPGSSSDIPRSHITLLTLGVLPAYQRRGIGRSLVRAVVQRLKASCEAGASSQRLCATSSKDVQKQDEKVLIQVQVAQSNAAGKYFYTHLGMMDQCDTPDPRLQIGIGLRMSVMAGVLSI